jgi:hypothetical protein
MLITSREGVDGSRFCGACEIYLTFSQSFIKSFARGFVIWN